MIGERRVGPGSPQDVAHAAAYFASDDGALVSGAVLDLDQGPVGALPNL